MSPGLGDPDNLCLPLSSFFAHGHFSLLVLLYGGLTRDVQPALDRLTLCNSTLLCHIWQGCPPCPT